MILIQKFQSWLYKFEIFDKNIDKSLSLHYSTILNSPNLMVHEEIYPFSLVE